MTFSRDGNQCLMSFYGKARRAQTSAPLMYLNVISVRCVAQYYLTIFLLIWISFGLILSGFLKRFGRNQYFAYCTLSNFHDLNSQRKSVVPNRKR